MNELLLIVLSIVFWLVIFWIISKFNNRSSRYIGHESQIDYQSQLQDHIFNNKFGVYNLFNKHDGKG